MKLIRTYYPFYIESKYKANSLKYVKSTIKVINEVLINQLPALLNQRENFRRADDYIDDFERAINYLKERYKELPVQLSFLLNLIVKDVRIFSTRQVSKIDIAINRIGINDDLEMLIKSWTYNNVRLIKSIPLDLLDDVATIIQIGFGNGSTLKVIKEEIQHKFVVTEKRAKFIARDQIAKLNSDIIRNECKQYGLSLYKWSSSHDDRVRKSHEAMNDKICSWDNPKIYKDKLTDNAWLLRESIKGVEEHTGQDYQCRCTPLIILP